MMKQRNDMSYLLLKNNQPVLPAKKIFFVGAYPIIFESIFDYSFT